MKNSNKRYTIALPAKILILLVIVGLLFGGVYKALKSGVVKASDNTNKILGITVNDTDEDGNILNTDKVSEDTLNLSLDEWIG